MTKVGIDFTDIKQAISRVEDSIKRQNRDEAIRAANKLENLAGGLRSRCFALPSDELILQVDFSQTTEVAAVAAKLHLHWHINWNEIPLEQSSGIKRYRARLFYCGPAGGLQFSSHKHVDMVVQAMKEAGFEPGGVRHGVALAEKYPEKQELYPIVCLGTIIKARFKSFTPCLGSFEKLGYSLLHGNRCLEGNFSEDSVFLGVREENPEPA